ncbi:MAG: GNAT family N-acetyltransferase [Anaerolineales bacterium]|nr:GNAT family N-acetyltransferase [Anaerolineales bacterium]
MNEKLRVEHVETPEELEWGAIGSGLRAYNTRQAGDDNYRHHCYLLKHQDEDEAIVGGVIGASYWGWLYIDLMWVREDLRGQGYGRRLLTLAEEAALECGATHAYLDTFSFQAPDFYHKLGYEVFGELKDFPPGHNRFFMTKALT